MYQCLLNKRVFFLLPKLDIDIQNPGSVSLKKKWWVLLCANHPIGIEKEEKKKNQKGCREETAAWASLRAGEVLVPTALPRTDVTQQTPARTIP